MELTYLLAIIGDLEVSRRLLQVENEQLKAQLADLNKGGIEADKVDKL